MDNIVAQSKELQYKAQIKEMTKVIHDAEVKLKLLDNELLDMKKKYEEEQKYSTFLRGQVEAYEKVLSHIIYNETEIDC